MTTKKEIIKSTRIYGVIQKSDVIFDDSKINKEFPPESSKLKKIKIWFGIPPNQEKDNDGDGEGEEKKSLKSLLGIQCLFENFCNNKKKQSEYHGCKITGNEIETKELEVTRGDYFNKLNLGFDNYITHIKFTTKQGKIIEFGDVIAENEKTFALNNDDNLLNFPFGRVSEDGIKALGIKYISKKDYFMRKYKELLILRKKFKEDQKEAEKYYKNLNKYDMGIKCLIMISMGRITPDTDFASVIKFY